MIPKKAIGIVTVVLIVVVVASSLAYLNYQEPFIGTTESITLGIYPSEYNSLILLAKDENYFSANGLNVTLKHYTSGSRSVAGMLNDEVDLATSSEFVVANNVLRNASIYALGTVSKYLNVYLAVRSDQGINTPTDLVGKRIGVTIGTSNQYFLARFLELNRVNQSQVTLVNLNFAETPNALANGTVDAAVDNPPYTNQIQNQLGNNCALWSIQSNQFGYFEAVCKKNWAATNPDLITRFLKAIVQAETFIEDHRDQALQQVARDLNYSTSYLASVWADYQYSVTIDQSFVLLMQEEARWLINNNISDATTMPDFLSSIYVQGLKSVNPNSVNLAGLGG